MKIEKQINYTLTINGENGHGIVYQQSLDNDLASLMISLDVLEKNLQSLKELKKEVNGEEKRKVSNQIYVVSTTIRNMNGLVLQLCESYELLKASADIKEKKEAITNL